MNSKILMSILEIVTFPDPLLRRKSLSVNQVDQDIRKLMDDMLETMYHDQGVGLAAVQAGILKRVIVMDLKKDDDQQRPQNFYPLYMANPEIIDRSIEATTATEGCLSVPEQRIDVARSCSVKLKYIDYNNKNCELEASGWLARVIQHELDHLEGKLLVDYLSSIKKDVVVRKLKKLKKEL